MSTTCPTCHQPLARMRCGIRLPVLKTRIFDVIKAVGDLGISRDELLFEIHRDRRQPSASTITERFTRANGLCDCC
jgi:hypothetical protein